MRRRLSLRRESPRKPGTSGLMLLLALALLSAVPVAAQTHYKQLSYPPLRDLQLPKVERVELTNGLVLYLVEDHLLPKVQGYALIKTGARWEPAEKVGLASIVGQVMRTGGTATRPGEEIDRLLANAGASVETRVGTEAATASLFALQSDLPMVLEILADLLRHPAFPEDKIELAKVQERSAIARRNDDVGEIADREFAKLLYGSDSPYARHTEFDTVERITRDDLVAFYQAGFQPERTILGLWGDFQAEEAKALVERNFGTWERGGAPVPAVPEVPKAWAGSVNFIQKDDVNQTNLRLGHLGGRFDDPDYYALNVMAEVLGGGLSSRLFRHVRSDLGLAYAVFAAWSADYDHPGSFYVFCNTKSESTIRATQEIIKELQRLTQEPVTAEELRVAKEGILNSFVFNFDTTGKIVQRLMTYEYYGYPRDFLEKFKANVEKVTAEDVLRATQKNLHPDQLVLLAVGRQQDFDQPLSTLGPVRTIDIAIPAPKAAAPAPVPEATPESLVRGREILEAAIAGLGGREKLEGIRDISILAEVVRATPQGEMTLTTKSSLLLPDKIRTDIATPFGAFSMAYDGQSGWLKTPQGTNDLPAEQVDDLRKLLARTTETLLLEALKADRPAQYLETVSVEGQGADVILVEDTLGEQVKFAIEKGTGRVLKKAFQTTAPQQGLVEQEQVYSDFQPVDGLTVAFQVVTYHNGEKVSESRVKSYEFNVGLAASLFAREEEEKEKKPE